MIPIDVIRTLDDMGIRIIDATGKDVFIDKMERTITIGDKAKASTVRSAVKQFNTKPFKVRRAEELERVRLARIEYDEKNNYRFAKDIAGVVADAAKLLSDISSIDGRVFLFKVQKHVNVFGVELPEKVKLLTRYGNEYTIYVSYKEQSSGNLGTWQKRSKTVTIRELGGNEWNNHDRGDTFIHEIGHAWNEHSGSYENERATRLAHECEAEAFVLMAYESFLDVPSHMAIEHTGQMLGQFAKTEYSKWSVAANSGKEE